MMKQGHKSQSETRQTPRFINGNDLSICWSQFTRVSWAQHTMAQPTYELPAPLQRVHKTTGNAAGEHPETPPSCTDHQMTQMGRNQTKTRVPLYKDGPLSKAIHATNWGNLAMQHFGLALLLAWALRHSKWNQIYGSLLQKVVKIKRNFKKERNKAKLTTVCYPGTACSALTEPRCNEPSHFLKNYILLHCTTTTKASAKEPLMRKATQRQCWAVLSCLLLWRWWIIWLNIELKHDIIFIVKSSWQACKQM